MPTGNREREWGHRKVFSFVFVVITPTLPEDVCKLWNDDLSSYIADEVRLVLGPSAQASQKALLSSLLRST